MRRIIEKVLRAGGSEAPSAGRQHDHDLPDALRRLQRRDSSRVAALTLPPTIPAKELDRPDDPLVLGVEKHGEARVYLLTDLRRHHIVNDELGGKRFLATFCAKCFSGMGFDPTVRGRVLTFEVYGLLEGDMVMRDEQTGTLWGQLTGEALAGELAGERLSIEPVHITTWSRWIELYPDCWTPDPRVLAGGRSYRPQDFKLTPEVRATVSHWDGRLKPTTLVLGVDVGDRRVAYPLDADAPGPRLAQDDVDGVPIALLAEPGAWPLAYDRRVDGAVVELRLDGDRVFSQDGTMWTGEGVATDGTLAGTALRFVPSRLSRWYAWAAYHPGTEVRRHHAR